VRGTLHLGPDLPARPLTSALLDRMAWGYVTPTYAALGLRFRIRTTNPAVGAYFADILQPMAADGAAAHTYSVVERETRSGLDRYRIYLDGHRILSASAPGMVVATLLWHLNVAVVDTSGDWLLLHASAAELDGATALFVAPMEHGKTTLVAAMVRAGLRYVTDEAVAIDPSTGLVHPFHKPLSIGPGSFPVLPELEPSIPADVEQYLSPSWNVSVSALRSDALAPVSRPAVVVLPRYDPDSSTQLEPITKAEALVELAGNAFNLADHGPSGFATLADLVRGCDCYRLTVNDLGSATELVVAALGAADLRLAVSHAS
jgi:hypothetical protein